MGTRLLVMQCSERGLGYLSLVFGLLAVGTLSLSVATDFWLFTSEGLKLSPPEDAPPGAASYEAAYDELNMTEIDEVDGEMAMDYSLPLDGTVQVNVHSGLWRLCMYSDDQGTLIHIQVSTACTLSVKKRPFVQIPMQHCGFFTHGVKQFVHSHFQTFLYLCCSSLNERCDCIAEFSSAIVMSSVPRL